jgi:L-seryl-tRNA(Ser) seleniumtransferase
MTSSSPRTERTAADSNPYRVLPPISRLLNVLVADHIAPEHLTYLLRTELDCIRSQIDEGARPTEQDVLQRCQNALDALSATRFDEVINGTGVVLHTNLGRAPVSAATAAAMASAASSYLSLELDPETNKRGGRMDEIARLMRLLTGAQATLVVNNNAAAVLLTLAAVCAGRDVIVSRGEAVEIGGGFRIPEVVAQSGCRLMEVGTTNRTYAADYVRALSESTGALLRVHPSNFRVEGFVSTPSTAELAAVAVEHGTILVEDLGSGALLDTTRFGLRPEPTVEEALSAGAAVVTFSGDKLLGGPQAGIICGRAEIVETIGRHPLARAVRADKTTLAGVAATLRHYVAGNPESTIPVWQMLSANVEGLRSRANAISIETGSVVIDSTSSVGGGSLPGEVLPSVALSLTGGNADELARRLRMGAPRVFPVIRDGAVLIDLRTVQSGQDELLARAILGALDASAGE